MEKLKSRKFWVAVITSVVMLVSALTGVNLNTEQILAITMPITAYLLGQAWVDSKNGK